MKTFKVTCLKCKESDNLAIDEQGHVIVDFGRKAGTNFLSGRWRGDLQWGWECICGNDNRLAASEAEDFDTLVQGSGILKIAESLKIPDVKQFRMETV